MNSPPIPLSENRDVLREVLIVSAWETVVLLFSDPKYGPVISTIIQDNTFWYDRLATYLRSSAPLWALGWTRDGLSSPDYKKVYVAIQRADKEIDQHPPSIHGATYLPSLLLIEELYGFPFESYSRAHTQSEFWEAIDDVNVLNHVLSSRKYSNFVNLGIHREIESLLVCLLGSVKRQNVPLCMEAAAILSIRSKSYQHRYEPVLREAIAVQASRHEPEVEQAAESTLAIVASLRMVVNAQDNRPGYYVPIADSGNVLMWNEFREVFKSEPELLKDIVALLTRGNGVGLSFVIEQEGADILKEARWTKHLLYAIKEAQLGVVKVLLPLSDVATKKNQALVTAAHQSLDIFTLVLSDPRIRPMDNIQEVILSILDGPGPVASGKSKWYTIRRQENRDVMKRPAFSGTWEPNYPTSEEHLLVLTRDSRFDLRKLDLDELRLLSYGLSRSLSDRLAAWDEVTSLVDPSIKQARDELVRMVEERANNPSVLDVLLRAILFCNLDPIPLARWMLASRENEFSLASYSITHQYIPRGTNMQVIRALLLVLVEDDVSIRDQIVRFREEGMNEDDILLAVRLAALALGLEGTRRRI